MRFDIITLFPDMIENFLGDSIIGRARKNNRIELYAHQLRDYSNNKHKKVDDTPYGGGKGMLMSVEPIANCYSHLKSICQKLKTVSVFMSPSGRKLNQSIAKEYSEYDRIIILCGHYEGVDRRAIDLFCDDEISIGDYVLTGGEIPACVFVDCVARLVDGVLSDPLCHQEESFSNGILEYPQYTKPQSFMGLEVPKVLLCGNHKEIEKYRQEEALKLTKKNRADLLQEE